jgi:hypothetical protein
VLCCAVLCCAVLCCAVLCCAVLCCAVLCCAACTRACVVNWVSRVWSRRTPPTSPCPRQVWVVNATGVPLLFRHRVGKMTGHSLGAAAAAAGVEEGTVAGQAAAREAMLRYGQRLQCMQVRCSAGSGGGG